MRLLIIEDEEKIGLPLKKALERHSYAVDYFCDGRKGFNQAAIEHYDCMILDLNLPGMDGLEIARRLRQENNQTPILMLTARAEQEDVIEGFENGTDDYLIKPFHFKELLLRINAIIKRNSLNRSEILTHRDIAVNTKLAQVKKGGHPVKLNSKEYGILEYLLRNINRTVTQEELLDHVWDSQVDEFTQTVRTHIKTLRQKIDPDKTIITTTKGSGYAIYEN